MTAPRLPLNFFGMPFGLASVVTPYRHARANTRAEVIQSCWRVLRLKRRGSGLTA
jgi:hypothetical protein